MKHTLDHQQCISAALKRKNPNWDGHAFRGHHHSDEARARISNALKGNSYASSLKGKPRPQEVRDKISATLKIRPGCLNTMFGKHHSEESKRRISIANTGRHWSEETKASFRNNGGSPGMLGKHHSAKTKAKIRAYWHDPIWVAKHKQAENIKPNQDELRLQNILDRYFPRQWKFVGDGQLVVGGKIPDFVNVNGKKQLIELFGGYWHNIFDIAQRKEHFRQYGFETAVIWDDELQDEERLRKSLQRRFGK